MNEILGYGCFSLMAIFWLAAYIGIIWRGFRDRSYGMPMIALALNLSWEMILTFVHRPHPDLAKYAVRTWLLLDVPVAIQFLLYSPDELRDRLVEKYVRALFFLAIVLCAAIVLGFIEVLRDIHGLYSAFGSNAIMSCLFVLMIISRDDVRGQSIYVALFKWLGTLFVFFFVYFWIPLSIFRALDRLGPCTDRSCPSLDSGHVCDDLPIGCRIYDFGLSQVR